MTEGSFHTPYYGAENSMANALLSICGADRNCGTAGASPVFTVADKFMSRRNYAAKGQKRKIM